MSDSVAIIGIGCRFPGDANNASNLWNMLMDGVDAVSEVFPERWSVENYYHPVRGAIGKKCYKMGGADR